MYLLNMLFRGPVPVNGRLLNVSGRDMVERSAVPVNGVPSICAPHAAGWRERSIELALRLAIMSG